MAPDTSGPHGYDNDGSYRRIVRYIFFDISEKFPAEFFGSENLYRNTWRRIPEYSDLSPLPIENWTASVLKFCKISYLNKRPQLCRGLQVFVT